MMKKVNVLVVVDTQIDFESGSLGTVEAQGTVSRIVDKIEECYDRGYLIIDTKDTHGEDYLDTTEGKHLPVRHCITGTEGWKTVPVIRRTLSLCNAVDVIKDTFGSINLPSMIRMLASEQMQYVMTTGKNLKVVLVGWCTDICVITNALILKTVFPDAEIVVDSKCCAGVTPELHEAALAVMKSCQITVE